MQFFFRLFLRFGNCSLFFGWSKLFRISEISAVRRKVREVVQTQFIPAIQREVVCRGLFRQTLIYVWHLLISEEVKPVAAVGGKVEFVGNGLGIFGCGRLFCSCSFIGGKEVFTARIGRKVESIVPALACGKVEFVRNCFRICRCLFCPGFHGRGRIRIREGVCISIIGGEKVVGILGQGRFLSRLRHRGGRGGRLDVGLAHGLDRNRLHALHLRHCLKGHHDGLGRHLPLGSFEGGHLVLERAHFLVHGRELAVQFLVLGRDFAGLFLDIGGNPVKQGFLLVEEGVVAGIHHALDGVKGLDHLIVGVHQGVGVFLGTIDGDLRQGLLGIDNFFRRNASRLPHPVQLFGQLIERPAQNQVGSLLGVVEVLVLAGFLGLVPGHLADNAADQHKHVDHEGAGQSHERDDLTGTHENLIDEADHEKAAQHCCTGNQDSVMGSGGLRGLVLRCICRLFIVHGLPVLSEKYFPQISEMVSGQMPLYTLRVTDM